MEKKMKKSEVFDVFDPKYWRMTKDEQRKAGWQGDLTATGFVPAEQMRLDEFGFETQDEE